MRVCVSEARRLLLPGLVLAIYLCGNAARGAEIDLNRAVVVVPQNLSRQETRAVTLLVEEVEKRTGIRWKLASTWPDGDVKVLAVGPVTSLAAFAGPFAPQLGAEPSAKAEGFRIRILKAGRAAPV